MSTLQLQALAIIFAGWVNRAQQDVIVSVLRTLPRSTIRRIGLESRSITRPMSRASMVRSGRGRGRPTRRDTASTRSDESFPDRPVNSLIAPILFPVHTRREFDSTCAKSLRNLSPFGAETTRICRKSLHFPVDQGIRCRDGFATDSPHRHRTCVSGAFELETIVSRNNAAISRGLRRSGRRDPTRDRGFEAQSAPRLGLICGGNSHGWMGSGNRTAEVRVRVQCSQSPRRLEQRLPARTIRGGQKRLSESTEFLWLRRFDREPESGLTGADSRVVSQMSLWPSPLSEG